jgi:hypothetical protein
MIKQLVTATSFALGGAGVILVGYLSSNPLAFTHPVADVPSATVARLTIREVPVIADTDNVLVLPEVTLTPLPQRAAKSAAVARLDPCSDWTDVGAVFIHSNGATGVRSVRHLCSNDER